MRSDHLRFAVTSWYREKKKPEDHRISTKEANVPEAKAYHILFKCHFPEEEKQALEAKSFKSKNTYWI